MAPWRPWLGTWIPIIASPSPISSWSRTGCVRPSSACVREFAPDMVGLSVMTFQRRTAFKLTTSCAISGQGTSVVVGGYDPSLAPEACTDNHAGVVDFIVRGEGDMTFVSWCALLSRGDAFLRSLASRLDRRMDGFMPLHGQSPR